MTTQLFRSNFFRFFTALPLVALGLCWSSSTQAAVSLTVTAALPQSLGGDTPYFYNTVTIQDGGVLKVIPVGTGDGTGRVYIKANKIVIQANGTLDASAAGHRGSTGKDGGGPGGGKFAPNYSGGGGAFFGDGGAGTDIMCATGNFGIGGVKYGTVDPPFGLGSAGGAGGKSPGPIGGHGGGSVILEAAEIQIYGTITVAGGKGLDISGVGSGGGAGGEIRMQASTFTWGPNAHLLANGGLGGKATMESGGSGGGGLIWLRGSPAPPVDVELNVSGGAAADGCMMEGKGGDGMVVMDTAAFPCRDLDNDGVTATLCGGQDCDDADDKVHPMAKDFCDGIDNDCTSMVDDDPAVPCPAGLMCINGKCQSAMVTDGGMETDGGDAARPEVLEYRGGCSVPAPPSSAAPLAALGVAVAFGIRVARRGRRKRS